MVGSSGRPYERNELSGYQRRRGELIRTLFLRSSSSSQASFNTLQKICEDTPHKLDFDVQGRNVLDALIPEFIKYSSHSSQRIRSYCLEILQALSALQVPAIQAHIDAYIQALFSRASDESSDVRRLVCAALGLILSTRADKLVPEINNVVDYMVYCTKDADETVALEACEFWLTFAEDQNLKDQLRPHLPKIVPLLLNGMIYSAYDLLYLDVDEEDEAVPDKDSDIKPKNYSSKVHASHETNDPSSSTSGAAGKSREAGDKALEDDDDEDDDDYDDDDDDDGSGEWNIRKCSAAALDVLAVSFGPDLLEILLPFLKERLFSETWTERESGILALGAIAEGEPGGSQSAMNFDGTKELIFSQVASMVSSLISPSWCLGSSDRSRTKRLVAYVGQ